MILELLGIYGWKKLERPILAAIFTSDPLILMGSRGTSKTAATKQIAKLVSDASGFVAYSTPNNEFEDMVGIPSPKAMQEGKLDFIKSPISVWDKEFILCGEFNRCKPALQSKYLQLILDREVLGLPTNVTWVWADMNPLHYSGTNPLDAAAADRFAVVLTPPEYYELSEEDRIKVGMSKGGANFFSLKKLAPHLHDKIKTVNTTSANVAKARELFQQLMSKLIGSDSDPGLYSQIQETYEQPASEYLSQIIGLMTKSLEDNKKSLSATEYTAKKEALISGRRAPMIVRTFLANLAVFWGLHNRRPSPKEVEEIMLDVVKQANVSILSGQDKFDSTSFSSAHTLAVSKLKSVDNYWEYRFETEEDATIKTFLLLNTKNLETLDLGISEAITHLITINSSRDSADVSKRHVILDISHNVCNIEDKTWALNFTEKAALTLALAPLVMIPQISIELRNSIQNAYSTVWQDLISISQIREFIGFEESFSTKVKALLDNHVEKHKDSEDPFDWLPLHLFQSMTGACTVLASSKDLTEADYDHLYKVIESEYKKSIDIVNNVKKYIYPSVNNILSSYVKDVKADKTVIKSLFESLL